MHPEFRWANSEQPESAFMQTDKLTLKWFFFFFSVLYFNLYMEVDYDFISQIIFQKELLRSINLVSNMYKKYTTWKQNFTVGEGGLLAKRKKSEKWEGVERKLVGEGEEKENREGLKRR